MIKFPRITDHAYCSVQHSLQPVCYFLRRLSIDCITVIHAGDTKAWTSVAADSESSDRRTRRSCRSLKNPAAQTLLTCLNETQVGRDGDIENKDMLASILSGGTFYFESVCR